MNKQEAKLLREELNKVCKQFDVGYTVEVGNATFNDHDVTFKVTIAPQGTLTKQERDLQNLLSKTQYVIDLEQAQKHFAIGA